MSTPDLREARKKVLKHPTVEYIPLYPHPIAKGNQKEGSLRLTVIKDPHGVRQITGNPRS